MDYLDNYYLVNVVPWKATKKIKHKARFQVAVHTLSSSYYDKHEQNYFKRDQIKAVDAWLINNEN